MKLYVFLLSGLFMMGCSSMTKDGFNRGSIRQVINDSNETVEITDERIKEALSRRSQLPKNFKLAVYFKQPESSRYDHWRWTDKDKKEILEALGSVKKQGKKAQIFPLISSVVNQTDLPSLRYAAAKHGADALIVINGAGDVDRYASNYAASYLFVLPVFFINGNAVDGLFMASATMWDVRNEFLYMSAESEGTYSDKYAFAFPESDKAVLSKSKTQALERLKKNLVAMAEGY